MIETDVGALAIRSVHPNPAHVSATTSTRTTHFPRQPASPEFNLLLACLGEDVGANTERIHELVRDGLDWQELLRITEHHRVIPQTYCSLSRIDDLVPPEILQKLRKRYQANARQTLRLTRDLVRVLEHFESRGIPTLAYKGPALAQILTGDVTGRQFSDIDLLVYPSDVRKSKAALIEMGYTPHFSLKTREEESYIQSGYEYAFDYPDAANSLELKWRILPRFYAIDFDVSELFDRSVTGEIGGHPVRTLCPEDLLLVLCVHAAKHSWAELSLLWDISRLAESQPIDWDQVFEHARCLGVQRIVDVSFTLARNILNCDLPVSSPEVESGAAAVARTILPAIARSQEVDSESISYFRLMLGVREHWRDRVRLLFRLAFTPSVSEWDTVRLPGWLSPLYYVIRMYRLAERLFKHLRIEPLSLGRRWFGRARLPVVP